LDQITAPETIDNLDPFVLLDALIPQVSDLFSAIKQKQKTSHTLLKKLIGHICLLCDKKPNAVLAAIHLNSQASPIKQAIYITAFSYMLSKQQGIKGQTLISLLQAAMTCNMSFYELQVLLNTVDGNLTDSQRIKVEKHVVKSTQLVEAAGFFDPAMTKAMRQHHEKLDGSGYPNQLVDEEISTLALIIGICETYTARVDNRAHRKSLHPRVALSELFAEPSPRIKELLLNFVKSIGVYPPGTWVKLANDETALVIAVQQQNPTPIVKALFDPNDIPYMGAIPRDCSLEKFKVKASAAPPCRPSVQLSALFS